MASSRLIVKNLPKTASEEKLKELFSRKGTVTDVKMKYTFDGRFRHFAFVGFKSPDEADSAKNYFDKTYIGACKIAVEICANLGETHNSYSVKTREKKSKVIEKATDEPATKKVLVEDTIIEKCQEDPEFAEFLETHVKKSSWGNDTIMEELKKKKKHSSKEDKKEEVDELETEEKTEETKIAKKKLPDEEYFTIKIRNIPKKAKKRDIKAFFKPLIPNSLRLPNNARGFAFVGFLKESDYKKALGRTKNFILGQQVQLTNYSSCKKKAEVREAIQQRWDEQEKIIQETVETVGESGRIFLRNLPYTTNENEIKELFEPFGPVIEVHLPIDRISRQIKGFGFITFMLPEHAAKAFSELDGTIYQGRMLHLLPSKNKEETFDESAWGSSYKKKKEFLEKLNAGKSHNWNTLFLSQKTVANVASTKYGVTKEDLLLNAIDEDQEEGTKNSSSAVRLALAETEIVSETKCFLEKHGVCLDAFELGSRPERSNTVLLVKNLQQCGSQRLVELFSKYGEIGKVVLPPSGVTAIVEFLEPAEARVAFKKLAYSKFDGMPLYLEWAPVNTFSKKSKKSIAGPSHVPAMNLDEPVPVKDIPQEREKIIKEIEEIDEHMIPEPDTTLFVKNLNFKTTDSTLKNHFETAGKVYSVNIAKKRDAKAEGMLLSMGYGFVQFYTAKAALEALKDLQNTMVDNHLIELKKSNRTLQSDESQRKETNSNTNDKNAASTKILVRNVPFQATKEEIIELFRTFGATKAVRLPLKLDGSGQHRGFAFIDFISKQDAKRAFETLCKSTHLYGRRLVIEWAAKDETVEELREKTAKQYKLALEGARETMRQKSTTKGFQRYFGDHGIKKKPQNDDEDEDEDDEIE